MHSPEYKEKYYPADLASGTMRISYFNNSCSHPFLQIKK